MAIDGVMVTSSDNGEEILVSDDVRLSLKKSKDSVVRIKIRKDANGRSFNEAKETAGNIDYSYAVEGNSIVLDDFLSTSMNNKFRDQEVRITLFIPEGKTIQFDNESVRCIRMGTKMIVIWVVARYLTILGSWVRMESLNARIAPKVLRTKTIMTVISLSMKMV